MIALLLSLFLLLFPLRVQAINDPLSVPNNKYGMHIVEFNDIPDVATLVNSNGGDWGYLTIVASDNDRDPRKWQTMFDQMRRLHLIPIVRIATHLEGANWAKPNPDRFEELAQFFNNLNWPVENRYIVLYNEPNHAKEWGGTIDPEGYALTLLSFARRLKSVSEDFFILPAGLDASAVTDGASMNAAEFLRRMVNAQSDILTVIDGWTSHSYPNPGFSGSPYASGRGTLGTYRWELGYLRSLGLTKNLPVFITETGWVHSQGKVIRNNLASPETVGENLKIAAVGAWSDPTIVAVTPFVFNYQDVPFDNFSWKKLGDNGFYAHYDEYESLPKTSGTPSQREKYELSDPILPPKLVANSSYTLKAEITNRGQGILQPGDAYELVFDDNNRGFSLVSDPLPTLEPNETGSLQIHLKTPERTGVYPVSLKLRHNTKEIPIQSLDIEIVPPPSLRVTTPLGWRRVGEATDVRLLVYDDKTLLREFTGLTIKNGEVGVTGLTNIVPGRSYRVVAVVPYYLPRQRVLPLTSAETKVAMKRLYPLDIDNDGKLTIFDVLALITKPPHNMTGLFVSP